MLQADIDALSDPTFIPDGSSGVYTVFMLIGIIGYFTIPSVANWILQSGGLGSANSAVNRAAGKGSSVAGGMAGAAVGNISGRLIGK
jgi:hypothetical protein